jgi:hypothetical protein
MTVFACRNCGATDGFESIESVPTKFYLNGIRANSDGGLEAIYSGDSKSADGESGDGVIYLCGSCGDAEDSLEALVKAI